MNFFSVASLFLLTNALLLTPPPIPFDLSRYWSVRAHKIVHHPYNLCTNIISNTRYQRRYSMIAAFFTTHNWQFKKYYLKLSFFYCAQKYITILSTGNSSKFTNNISHYRSVHSPQRRYTMITTIDNFKKYITVLTTLNRSKDIE